MHNRPRKKLQDIDVAKEEAKKKKILKYNELKNQVLELRKNGVLSDEVLQQLELLLTISPEFYTLWNYRKEIVEHKLQQAGEDQAQRDNIYRNELRVTEKILREQHLKSYGTWHHRKMMIKHLYAEDWERDLKLTAELLQMDERNFHCWNYRRFVYDLAYPDNSKFELDFTKYKIEQKPNNYSAWHNRSALITPTDSVLEEELDFVTNEFYTDPSDQSPWIYHRWLFNCEQTTTKLQEKDLKTCQELLQIEPDCKWALLTVIWLQLKSSVDKPLVADDEQQVMDSISKLKSIDTMHSAYYEDLRSDVILSQAYLKQNKPVTFIIKNAQLTRFDSLLSSHALTHLDLSGNLISSIQCLSKSAWPSLITLNLSNNMISYIENLSFIPNLRVLLVRNNKIQKLEPTLHSKIEEINLQNNPLEVTVEQLKSFYFPSLKIAQLA